MAVLCTGCKTAFYDPKHTSGDADFSRYVAVGSSFSAGFSDNALYLQSQQNSFPAILASRFALADGGSFTQPLVNAGNGLGNKLVLNFGNTCTGLQGYSYSSLSSDISNTNWIGSQGPFNNLSVPEAKSYNLNDPSFGKRNLGSIYYNRFASDTGTSTILGDMGKISNATGNGPTFFSFWIGIQDVFGYATEGGENDSLTSIQTFNTAIDTVINVLSSYSGQGVMANIPDIESLPFFNTIPYNGLTLTQAEADQLNATSNFIFTEGANGFIIKTPLPGDQTSQISQGQYILYSAWDSIRCNGWGTPQKPIPSKYILDFNEIIKIHSNTTAYNSKLQNAAVSKNLAFADMNQFFKTLQSGILFNNVNFNAQYLTGGAFSLDGIHPNSRGYALIANEFIRVINAKYKSTIPPVDVNNYPGIRFP